MLRLDGLVLCSRLVIAVNTCGPPLPSFWRPYTVQLNHCTLRMPASQQLRS